jgi:hypothetical protein
MTQTLHKTRTGLPPEQITAYWREVESSLRTTHHLEGDVPLRAISRYRNEVDGVGGMLYHQTPDDVAHAIVEGGYVDDAPKQ